MKTASELPTNLEDIVKKQNSTNQIIDEYLKASEIKDKKYLMEFKSFLWSYFDIGLWICEFDSFEEGIQDYNYSVGLFEESAAKDDFEYINEVINDFALWENCDVDEQMVKDVMEIYPFFAKHIRYILDGDEKYK